MAAAKIIGQKFVPSSPDPSLFGDGIGLHLAAGAKAKSTLLAMGSFGKLEMGSRGGRKHLFLAASSQPPSAQFGMLLFVVPSLYGG